MNNMNNIYLSIVAASRNDNHGNKLDERTNLFIKSIAENCKKYKIQTELLLVEWNQIPNTKTLNDRLMSIFGIGSWSVNMFEIFCLGELDVFTSKDAGLRLAMNRGGFVKPDSDWEKYDSYAEKWSPYKTIASLHLWKTVD